MIFDINTNNHSFSLAPSKWKIYRRYKKIKYEGVNGHEDVKIKGYILVAEISWQFVTFTEFNNVKVMLSSLANSQTISLVSIRNKNGSDAGIISSPCAVIIDTDDVTINEGEFLPNTPLELTLLTKEVFHD